MRGCAVARVSRTGARNTRAGVTLNEIVILCQERSFWWSAITLTDTRDNRTIR